MGSIPVGATFFVSKSIFLFYFSFIVTFDTKIYRMRIFSISLAFLALLMGVSSCIEHEVVPPPTNTVNLDCDFTGYVSGTQVEFTQNIDSYLGNTSSETFVQPSQLPSRRVYMFEMTSPTNPVSIRIKLGALNWDLAANSEPSLTMFNDFNMNASTTAP